jgi:hypothetical protein
MKKGMGGIAVLKLVFLLLLVAVVAAIFQYQYGLPGETVVDRFWAKPIGLNLDELDSKTTQAEVQRTYHRLRHTCHSNSDSLGDHVCWAPISKFNALDARLVAFFFNKGQLSAVRVSFRSKSHPVLLSSLKEQYGETRDFGKDGGSRNIVGWMRPTGIVAMNDQVEPQEDVILLWTSRHQIFERMRTKHEERM